MALADLVVGSAASAEGFGGKISMNELMRGQQNIAMRIDSKGVHPECFNRRSSSGLAWILEEAFGNDGF